MPSGKHQAPLALVRADPDLVARLLSRVFGWDIGAYHGAYPHSEDVEAAISGTYRADAVMLFHDQAGQPVAAVVVEVQRSFDRHKQRTWALYLAHTGLQFDLDPVLLVYCPSVALGRRYRSLLEGHVGSLAVRPFIVTPENVPLVTDVDAARADPAMTVMGVLAHADSPQAGFDALLAALTALGSEQALTYHDLVVTGLSSGTRKEWMTYMSTTTHGSSFLSKEFQAIEAKGIEQGLEQGIEQGLEQGIEQGLEQGMEQGLEQGIEQGREQGLAKGRSEGQAMGVASSLVKVLTSRGIEVSPGQRAKIEAERNLDVLNVWIERAVTADTCAEVLGAYPTA